MIRSVLPFAFVVFLTGTLHAQMPGGPVGADSLTSTFVPVVSYSSDEGIIGGVIYNRYDYRGNVKPFRNYLETKGLVSTRAFIEIEGTYRQSRTFGRRLRSRTRLYFRRYTADNYFGIGNQTSFSDNRWEDEYYYFESIGLGLSYRLRKPLFEKRSRNYRFDLLGGVSTEYQIPYTKSEQTSFADRVPNGSEGGWINFLMTGFVWENRDSEFDPHHGNMVEFEVRFAPDPVSDFALTTTRLELRKYFYLFNYITVAHRLEARNAAGDVPYWEMSTLGDDNTLRGYPLNRFQGNTSLAYTLELRSWILKFPQFLNLKFGGQLFTDTGRVFTGEDDFNDLFHGYHQTYGFGGAVSIINPDFILRGDVGFSEDMTRIYLGIGYLF